MDEPKTLEQRLAATLTPGGVGSFLIARGWRIAPGDAGLTRRVKAAGPSWAVVEKRGRKTFSKGLWAPLANITAARAALDAERATEGYAKKRAAATARLNPYLRDSSTIMSTPPAAPLVNSEPWPVSK